MNWCGYAGKILNIDLGSGEIWNDNLNFADVEEYIGGMGLNCRLASKLIPPKVDPLSPDNPIIIGTGPLVGTIMPGASRTVAITKFPATRAIANSCGSMSFGYHLKQAGYDHIIIQSALNVPKYLLIDNNEIHIKSAENLWTKDIIEATDYLKRKYGDSGVIAIGQAGENLVSTAMTLIDKTSTFGRGGLAAILGSKKLKAIVVKGSTGIEISNSKKFNKLYLKLINRIKTYSQRKSWIQLGMLRSLPIGMILAAKGQKRKSKQCSERIYLKKIKSRRIACPSCPMADKDILKIEEGPYSGLKTYTSSVINPFLMLTLDGLETYDQAIKAFDQINRYGLDSLTITTLLQFLTKMNKEEILTEETTGFDWKMDYLSVRKLIEIITFRQGFGDLLADGWKALSDAYPELSQRMLTIKNLDVVFEPRFLRLGTMEFEQVVNPKGAHVASGGSPTYVGAGSSMKKFKNHFNRMGIPESAFKRLFTPPIKEMGIHVGRLTRYSEDWYTMLTSLGLCARAQMNRFYSLDLITEFFRAITGLEFTKEDIREAAERTWNLLKLLNAKEDFSRKDDKFPSEWFKS
ncbi:MAG: hypothetical protein GF317_21930, partial [Candidatus Lokiarchaeota archaeon]|nr:hypothetical protein [Candidatus Lokiarchaeota archaeon]MBD3202119.1 hypothetical protein [Candidatus Lokiarchaeota archaeon]